MKVRVKFAKYGCMRFIGHLDVMRFFQKALRRAGIDVAYSTGFSPHQIMSFASPLGVGMCSNGEYMDIELRSTELRSAKMCRRLNEACVPGIEVLSVKVLPETAGNAMASVAAARYTVHFKDPSSDFHFLEGALEGFLEQPGITVTKETKKGSSQMDIRPGIYECRVTPEGRLEFMVDASSGGNIKPALLLGALWEYAGMEQELPLLKLQLTREETYTNTGTAEKPVFVPLDEVGDDF
nr:TIGR03936 family radical SAM-associated protein [uncultured Eisenbergiella sp.]